MNTVKKVFAYFSVMLMLLGMLSTAAFAAGSQQDVDGIYGITGTAIGQPEREDGTACTADTAPMDDSDFYPEAVRFTVTCTGLTSGEQYVVYVLNAKETPDAENLYYMNQATAVEGTVRFSVYPKAMAAGSYYVYVVGDGSAFNAQAPLASYKYYVSPHFTVSVTGKGYFTGTKEVSLQIAGGTAIKQEITASGNTAAFPDCKCGTYTISAPGFVTWQGTVEGADGDTVNVKLLCKGDIDGNGAKVEDSTYGVLDMQALYAHLCGDSVLEDSYSLTVADVNGDGSVNILDYQALYELVK